MLDKELVSNKLNDLSGYYQRLEELAREDAIEIIRNDLKLHTVERLFQLIVDIAVDINTHIISETDMHMPDDYFSTFVVLGENRVLPVEFSLKIAPSVGLRNLVVHKYGKVDTKKMIDDIKAEISDYAEYMKYINDFIA